MSQKSGSEQTPTLDVVRVAQCHIHDDLAKYADDIRENVCVKEFDFHLTRHTDGKSYCLFHLPTNEKPVEEFEQLFKKRLSEIEVEIIRIESELPEEERDQAKREVRYDFRAVWFSFDIDLKGYKFNAPADFSFATFTRPASFRGAVFTSDTCFIVTTFYALADFWLTTFLSRANFAQAAFASIAGFTFATFLAYAGFHSSIFLSDAVFAFVKFRSTVEFTGATFGKAEAADADFLKAEFTGDTLFDDVTFNYQAIFRSAVFGSESDVYFRRTLFAGKVDFSYVTVNGYLRFNTLSLREDSSLNFQESAIEKSTRISFHSVHLHPNWFVNTDPRKFIFTDITWRNIEFHWRNQNIKTELAGLEPNGTNKRLLEIACHQLAANAEQNDRYEEASKFRYMAMESRRLAYRWQGKLWTINWWYKVSSGYGENWKRAFIGLCVLLFLVFPLGFSMATFQVCPNDKPATASLLEDEQNSECHDKGANCNCRKRGLGISNGEALIHSLEAATFQNIESRKPVSYLGEMSISLEKILVPLQAALLALAIRRKFMR